MPAPIALAELTPGPRCRLSAGGWGCLLGLLLALTVEGLRIYVLGNVHAVITGRVYRCAQPSPAQLERLIQNYGIRTVINLRGFSPPSEWYVRECRVTHHLNVSQEDICFSAGRLPPPTELRRLVDALEHTDTPVLFHCQRGADRTGLASAVALLLLTDTSFATARRQLGLRYGHLALGRPAELDRFFDLYQAWLHAQHLQHSPDTFRRWSRQDYCPGPCRARLEILDMPSPVPCLRPFGVRVRAWNTSLDTWHLRPGTNAGIHACYTIHDDQYRSRGTNRAGLFATDVPPGHSIDLTLPVPSLPGPGRYHLTIDMMDEQHCCFYQVGSEPLEQELESREEDMATGVQRGPAGPSADTHQLAPGR